MSYTWTTGETITAAKLNATGTGLCTFDDDTVDKSYNELLAMFNSGIIPCFVLIDGIATRLYQCNILRSDGEEYSAVFYWFNVEDPTDNSLYYFISFDPDDLMVVD